jgi:hypothetical protein
MNQEFTKTDKIITSSKGFTVEVKIAGGILYTDGEGKKYISSEWLAKPPGLGIILYKGSRGSKGFDKMEESQIDSIFSNTIRALKCFGYEAEIWSSPFGPDKIMGKS